jgi:hypothetical protein
MKHAHIPKSLLLAAFLCTVSPYQAEAISMPHGTTLRVLAGAGLVATGGYCANWVALHWWQWRASRRYELPIVVVTAYADDPREHDGLYQELFRLISVDNANWSAPHSRYHNYPLVEFVHALDFYIHKLWIGSWFAIPMQLSYDADRLKQQLERVRFFCTRHPSYIEQRRTADQRAMTAS